MSDTRYFKVHLALLDLPCFLAVLFRCYDQSWTPFLLSLVVIYMASYSVHFMWMQSEMSINRTLVITLLFSLKIMVIWLTDAYSDSTIFLNTILIQSLAIHRNLSNALQSKLLIQLISIIALIPFNKEVRMNTNLILNIIQVSINFGYLFIQEFQSSQKQIVTTIFTKLSAVPSFDQSSIHLQGSEHSTMPWFEMQIIDNIRAWLKSQKYIVVDYALNLLELNFNLHQYLKEYKILTENDLFKMFLDSQPTYTGQSARVQSMKNLQCSYTITALLQTIFSSKDFDTQLNQFQVQYTTFDFRNHLITCLPYRDVKLGQYLIMVVQYIEMKSEDDKFILNNVCKSISHELSTNLNCIMATSSEALKDEQLPSLIKIDYFQPINISVEQLALITGNIRDFGALETDQFQLKLVVFDIIYELSIVIRYFMQTAQAKGIQIHINHVDFHNFEYKQIECNNNFNIDQIFNDVDRLKQIFYQILSNAIRYTVEGVISIEIQQSTLVGTYLISITDSGVGMNEQEQQNLRQVLQRNKLFQISTQSIGSSLGLFISNRIIQKMNGPTEAGIVFRSEMGKGTRMSFILQDMVNLAKSKRDVTIKGTINTILSADNRVASYFFTDAMLTSPCNRESDSGPHLMSRLSNLQVEYHFKPISSQSNNEPQKLVSVCCSRVLIVDDEFYNIFALKTLLRRYNTICDSAFNGQEAIKKINERLQQKCNVCNLDGYQLIFIDINMPIMDGFQTVKMIKQMVQDQRIPSPYCIANTAFTDLETKLRCFECGMDMFITKPVGIKELSGIIDRLFPQNQVQELKKSIIAK